VRKQAELGSGLRVAQRGSRHKDGDTTDGDTTDRDTTGRDTTGQDTTGQSQEGARDQPAPGRWRRMSRGRRWAFGSAIVVTVLAVMAGLTGYAVYAHLDGNLRVVNSFGGLRHRPPPSAPGVLNILVLGSQTRDGQGPGFGFDPGTNLSDNLLLVHLDATRTHATIVSIPRDTLVYEPACKSRVGKYTVPAIPDAMIDGAMNQGGPSCAVATVERLTQIRVDHFVEFDFNSFRAMVDTVGGVEVCVPRGGYYDPWSRLRIAGGQHLVTGNQALAFVRTRHGVGDGGDLGRIELQQEFISSLVQKMDSEGTLANPAKVLDIADTATKALTVDPGLGSIGKLLGLAGTLRHLHTSNVTFITMPTIQDPADLNRLLPQEPQDDVIWQMLRTGQLWNGQLAQTPASQVQLTVLNATGVPGLARHTARRLRKLGFDVVHAHDAPFTSSTTVTYQSPAVAESAYALMAALKQAPVTQDSAAQDSVTGNSAAGGTVAGNSAAGDSAAGDTAAEPVTLTLGPDFAGVRAPPRPRHHSKLARAQPPGTQPLSPAPAISPSGQPAVQARSAAANICSGMPAANPDVGTPP
jgi:LCP family protein required for cell wall assembly